MDVNNVIIIPPEEGVIPAKTYDFKDNSSKSHAVKLLDYHLRYPVLLVEDELKKTDLRNSMDVLGLQTMNYVMNLYKQGFIVILSEDVTCVFLPSKEKITKFQKDWLMNNFDKISSVFSNSVHFSDLALQLELENTMKAKSLDKEDIREILANYLEIIPDVKKE